MKTMSLVLLMFFTLAGCAAGITSNEIRLDAHYGPQPEFEAAQALATEVMQGVLKDPYSAQWSCKPTHQGQLGDHAGFGLGTAMTGWILPCDINSKNSYGAYGGAEQYVFVIVDGVVGRAMHLGHTENGVPTERIIYNK